MTQEHGPCTWDEVNEQNGNFIELLEGLNTAITLMRGMMDLPKDKSDIIAKSATDLLVCVNKHRELQFKAKPAGTVVTEADFPAYYGTFSAICGLIEDMAAIAANMDSLIREFGGRK